ncbi:MAG TPA: C45 family peptidase [Trueperaceae bacterium]|nr:C45 family peptidase [Trueperaceae bacterium]
MRDAVLRVAGDPYALGLAHGRALAAWVRDYAEERVRLACSPVWSGRESTRAEVMALARACLSVHEETYPDLAEELRGIADGAGLSPAELVVSGGFTDFVDAVAAGALGEGPHGAGAASDGAAAAGAPGGGEARPAGGDEDDCTAFLVPAARMADGAPAFAQTWDMHEGSADHLVLLEGRPRGAPAFVVMTTAGCVGMIGMNEAGLTVGINNLTAADGRVGVTWPFVVRAMLREETLEAALEVLARAPLCGGHNYLVMDAAGRGANVEAMPTARAVTALAEAVLVHTNHCLEAATRAVERPREPASQAESEGRLRRARELLARDGMDVAYLQAVTADPEAVCRVGAAPSFVGTCGAVVARPATRELWAVAGRPSEAPYERFDLAVSAS